MLTIGVMSIGSEYRHKTITRHLPGDAPAHPGDAGQGRRADRHRRDLRPDQPGRLGRRRRASCLTARGSTPFPASEVVRSLAPQPARPRAVGADRPRHRHPHPQPGGGAAHRHRRGLDRRAARWGWRWARGTSGASTSSSTCPPRPPARWSTASRRGLTPCDSSVVGRRPGAGRVRRGAGRLRHLAHRAPATSADPRALRRVHGPVEQTACAGASTRRTGRRRACDSAPRPWTASARWARG